MQPWPAVIAALAVVAAIPTNAQFFGGNSFGGPGPIGSSDFAAAAGAGANFGPQQPLFGGPGALGPAPLPAAPNPAFTNVGGFNPGLAPPPAVPVLPAAPSFTNVGTFSTPLGPAPPVAPPALPFSPQGVGFPPLGPNIPFPAGLGFPGLGLGVGAPPAPPAAPVGFGRLTPRLGLGVRVQPGGFFATSFSTGHGHHKDSHRDKNMKLSCTNMGPTTGTSDDPGFRIIAEIKKSKDHDHSGHSGLSIDLAVRLETDGTAATSAGTAINNARVVFTERIGFQGDNDCNADDLGNVLMKSQDDSLDSLFHGGLFGNFHHHRHHHHSQKEKGVIAKFNLADSQTRSYHGKLKDWKSLKHLAGRGLAVVRELEDSDGEDSHPMAPSGDVLACCYLAFAKTSSQTFTPGFFQAAPPLDAPAPPPVGGLLIAPATAPPPTPPPYTPPPVILPVITTTQRPYTTPPPVAILQPSYSGPSGTGLSRPLSGEPVSGGLPDVFVPGPGEFGFIPGIGESSSDQFSDDDDESGFDFASEPIMMSRPDPFEAVVTPVQFDFGHTETSQPHTRTDTPAQIESHATPLNLGDTPTLSEATPQEDGSALLHGFTGPTMDPQFIEEFGDIAPQQPNYHEFDVGPL